MQPDPEKLPPNIAAKLRSLQRVQEKIQNLEAELSRAQEECKRLEHEVAQYHASVAPIRRIPPEILTAIFEMYVIDRPTHIRRLLLVCRLWHELVMNTSPLWVYVRLVLDKADPVAIESALKYAQACYERSNQCPLYVTMDFSEIPSKASFIDNRVEATGLFDPTDIDIFYEDWFDLECLPYENVIRACTDLAAFVATQKKRWRSLMIGFDPDGALFEQIWRLFRGRTPILTELLMDECHPSGFCRHYLKVLTKAPLTNLKVQDPKQFSLIAASKPPLRSLECSLDYIINFCQIYNFKCLRELTLTCQVWHPEHTLDPIGSKELFLPSLEILSLLGKIPGRIHRLLQAPSLRDLTIRRRINQDFQGLPDALPLNITWEVPQCPSYERKKRPAASEIQEMFEKYSTVQYFVMYKCHMKLALELLADVRKKSGGLQHLIFITFIDESANIDNPNESKVKKLAKADNIQLDVRVGRDLDTLLAGMAMEDSGQETDSSSSEDHTLSEESSSTEGDSSDEDDSGTGSNAENDSNIWNDSDSEGDFGEDDSTIEDEATSDDDSTDGHRGAYYYHLAASPV